MSAQKETAPAQTTTKTAYAEFIRWWRDLTTKGDPIKRPNLCAEAFEAGYRAGVERSARVVEGGSFLHSESPAAKFATECAAAIRRELA